MRRVAALTAVAMVAAVAAAGAHAVGGECAGLQTCIDVPGPWVAVAPTGEAKFLLSCPNRRGFVGGIDALASSRDIHVSWDAQTGSPIAPGRTSSAVTFFRAVSGRHRAGLFEPRIGCVPPPNQGAQTTAYVPAGSPLDLASTNVPIVPGMVRRGSIGCVPGESLVDSWSAVAFTTVNPPDPLLATAVSVVRKPIGNVVRVTISVSEALPRAAGAIVQIGVRCAK